MLTFCDCLTLLLTFFVLLMTFSSIGDETIPGLRNAFRRVMPGFNWADKMYRNSLESVMRTDPVEAVLEGSEHATLEQGTSGGLKESADFPDPFEPRVFLIPSEKVFAGRATAISAQGRQILDELVLFLEKVPNGVVIGEKSSSVPAANNNISLSRLLAVIDYLTSNCGLEKDRVGISLTSVSVVQDTLQARGEGGERIGKDVLEIVLLGSGINK